MSRDAAFNSQLGRVLDLAQAHCNENTPVCEQAARNIVNGQPAFWSSSRGHDNALDGLFVIYVNAACEVENGFERLVENHPNHQWSDAALVERLLDKLIPLNEAAIADLHAAYGLLTDRGHTTRTEISHRLLRAELALSVGGAA